MKTLKEALEALTPKQKLTPGQAQRMAKVNQAFQELAKEIVDLCPENNDRVSALIQLRNTKFLAVQSITHGISPEDAAAGKKVK